MSIFFQTFIFQATFHAHPLWTRTLFGIFLGGEIVRKRLCYKLLAFILFTIFYIAMIFQSNIKLSSNVSLTCYYDYCYTTVHYRRAISSCITFTIISRFPPFTNVFFSPLEEAAFSSCLSRSWSRSLFLSRSRSGRRSLPQSRPLPSLSLSLSLSLSRSLSWRLLEL